jgi:frataxin
MVAMISAAALLILRHSARAIPGACARFPLAIPVRAAVMALPDSGCRVARHSSGVAAGLATEADFHRAADATLAALETAFTAVEGDLGPGSDVTLANGVLTVTIAGGGGKGGGTWVINKQTPNRQLWWSSPVSGPRRYALDGSASGSGGGGAGRWLGTRDGGELIALLRKELAERAGVALPLV